MRKIFYYKLQEVLFIRNGIVFGNQKINKKETKTYKKFVSKRKKRISLNFLSISRTFNK